MLKISQKAHLVNWLCDKSARPEPLPPTLKASPAQKMIAKVPHNGTHAASMPALESANEWRHENKNLQRKNKSPKPPKPEILLGFSFFKRIGTRPRSRIGGRRRAGAKSKSNESNESNKANVQNFKILSLRTSRVRLTSRKTDQQGPHVWGKERTSTNNDKQIVSENSFVDKKRWMLKRSGVPASGQKRGEPPERL